MEKRHLQQVVESTPPATHARSTRESNGIRLSITLAVLILGVIVLGAIVLAVLSLVDMLHGHSGATWHQFTAWVSSLLGWFIPIAVLVSGRWWVPLLWKAYTATREHVEDLRDRQSTRKLKDAAVVQVEQGFNLKYANERTGELLEIVSPLSLIPASKETNNYYGIQQEQQNLLAGPSVPKPPPFAEIAPLLRKDRLVLCMAQQGPVYGTVLDLLSMCVVGKPGRGKSTALLYYILILLMADAEVWIWDPHSGLNELAYGLNYQDDLMDIENSVPVLHAELDERRLLWKERKQVKQPLLLLVDEMPVIADFEQQRIKEVKKGARASRHDEDVLDEAGYDKCFSPSRLFRRFSLEARKWNCYVILSGQSLPAEVLSTLTRENLSSRIVFESCNMHAKMAGLQKEEIDKLMPMLKGAGPGVAVMDVSRWAKPEVVAIPYTTPADLRAFIDARNPDAPFIEDEEGIQDLSNVSPFPQHRADESGYRPFSGNLAMDVNADEKTVESIPAFSPEDERQIVNIARIHLATHGKVIRSKIPASMNPPRNNALYPVVKYICDREGW